MPHLAQPSYVPALGEAKKNLTLHRPRQRRGPQRRHRAWRCEWCGAICGREGCKDRRAALTTYTKHTVVPERRYDVAPGARMFTPTEAHKILASEPAPESPVPPQQWAPPYPVDVESVIA